MPDFPSPADLGFDEQMAASIPEGLIPARVAAGHRNSYTVFGDGAPRLVAIGGKLRHDARTPGALPAVGDWVGLDPGGTTIRAIGQRRGALRRTDKDSGGEQVLAANVDVAFIVTSANRDLNARRLERFVALALAADAQPVGILNKIDLLDDLEVSAELVREAIGAAIPLLLLSALRGDGIEALDEWLVPRSTAVLLGTSGVGKSTLTNALLGEDVQATREIRAIDDRGRHTTVIRELFVLPSGALLIDTPGLKLPRMTQDAATDAAFAEIAELAAGCRFDDCRHDREPGCAVRDAVGPDRLAAWRRLESEKAPAKRWESR